MYIRWMPCPEKDTVFLSPNKIQGLHIECGQFTLHFGALKKKIKVQANEELDDHTVGLPSYIADAYTIPDNLPYDLYFDGEDLHLGPVIAFFVRKGYLSKKRRRKWRLYCQNYRQIRGLVYFCTVEGVDLETEKIRGYYYDPDAEKAEQLKPGIFPFPGVVYRRARMSQDILRGLKKHVGDKFFNAHIFNKWEMWTVLSKGGFKHTPFTSRLNGINSLQMMLSRYQSLYLKPGIGRFGNGILKIDATPDGYLLKRKSGAQLEAKNLNQLYQLVEKYKRKKEYIIQQAVPLKYQEKPVDFRVILQKDATQEWSCSGVIAKIGMQGRIHTNTTTGLALGHDALEMVFELSPEDALAKENEMIRICTEACRLLEDAYGHYGDVGIDVAVDENLKIWILEINKSHQHDIARFLVKADPEIFKRVVTRPLEYARALSGFVHAEKNDF